MKHKNFNHNEVERCKLSGKKIYTDDDNYSIILDCVGDKIKSVGFYKTDLLAGLVRGNLGKIREEVINKHKTIAEKMINKLLKRQQ